jgi:capsular exopolysaccharide synthesis family protein
MPEFTGHKDLRSYLRMIWRWKFIFVVLLVAAPAVTFFLEHRKPKIYESSVLVSVNQASITSANGSTYSTSNIQAIAALLTTTPVADIAGNLLHPKVSGASIVGDVSVSPNPETGYIWITTTDHSPTRAAAIANAFANALGVNQRNQTIAALSSNVLSYRAELAKLSRSNPQYQQIQQELQAARAQLATTGSGAVILQPATPNYTAVGPDVKRAVLLGLVIGVLLAIGAVMLLEGFDRRMRSPDDLESLTELPLLAAIAPSAFSAELQTSPADDESFQMLRTALTYFRVDAPIHSVMFTSPGEKEGKSTVASRLALASAHAGLDVVLVDADLRRAGTTARFGLSGQPGLGTALVDSRPAETTMVDWPLAASAAGRLRILPAGPPPPNPAALVSSEAMRNLLTSLESQSDLVILDSPAALAVSDAVPLMHAVSGVVLVARMNHSNRDTIHRLHKIIDAAHGRIFGVVATGVTSGPGYEKYSHEYYDSSRRGMGKRRKRNGSGNGSVTLSAAGSAPAAPPEQPQAAVSEQA